jgi:hypothetical protein
METLSLVVEPSPRIPSSLSVRAALAARSGVDRVACGHHGTSTHAGRVGEVPPAHTWRRRRFPHLEVRKLPLMASSSFIPPDGRIAARACERIGAKARHAVAIHGCYFYRRPAAAAIDQPTKPYMCYSGADPMLAAGALRARRRRGAVIAAAEQDGTVASAYTPAAVATWASRGG